MLNNVEVSICISSYNQTKYLKKTFESFFAQSYQNFEVIVSDDSSTDDVERLVEEHKTKFHIFYVRNQYSLGSLENWNFVMSLAQADCIKVMHHDDWLSKMDLFILSSKEDPFPLPAIEAGMLGLPIC